MKNWTFEKAKRYEMKFGKFNHQTLDKISETDEGLKYLDYLVGQNFLYGAAKLAVETFLSDPAIKRELDRILGRE